MNVTVPSARAWPAIPREFYAFFQEVARGANTAGSIDLSSINQRLTTIEHAKAGKVQGSESIQTQGTDLVYVSLQGDSTAPGATQYYGTDGNGTKGWNSLYDVAKAQLVQGTGITITADDVAQTLTIAADGAQGAWTTVLKTTDETRNGTATLADDSALKFTATGGKKYRCKLMAFFTVANATMDFNWSANYTGLIGDGYYTRTHTLPGESTSVSNVFERIVGGSGALPATAINSSGFGYAWFAFELFFEATTTGVFSLQWAQGTSNAGDCTVLAGSSLEYLAVE